MSKAKGNMDYMQHALARKTGWLLCDGGPWANHILNFETVAHGQMVSFEVGNSGGRYERSENGLGNTLIWHQGGAK